MAQFFFANQTAAKEHLGAAHLPLVSWRSIVAGLVLAVICHVALSALGIAVMSASSSELFRAKSVAAEHVAIGTGLWMLVSILISLTAGGYFAARISNLVTTKIGGAQGLVIASLFFCALLFAASSAVGILGRTVGSVAQTATSVGDSLFSFGMMVDIAEQNLDGLKLKIPSRDIAKGLTSRLIRNDMQGATKYLSMQTGVPVNQLSSRMDLIWSTMRYNLERNSRETASAFRVGAWSVFFTLVFGVGFSIFGGLLGARANNRRPLVDQIEPLRAVPEARAL